MWSFMNLGLYRDNLLAQFDQLFSERFYQFHQRFTRTGSLTHFHNFTTSAYQPHFSGLCIAPQWEQFERTSRDGCGKWEVPV